MAKLGALLAGLQEPLQEMIKGAAAILPEEILQSSPKISRGENYLGLPYLVLDQPRYFDRENIFAIRTMFWWGHFFSCTLHLSGAYKDRYSEQLSASFGELQKESFYICHSLNQWDHHFEADNYMALQQLDKDQFDQLLKTHPFVKLAKRIPLDEWETIDKTLTGTIQALIKTLG